MICLLVINSALCYTPTQLRRIPGREAAILGLGMGGFVLALVAGPPGTAALHPRASPTTGPQACDAVRHLGECVVRCADGRTCIGNLVLVGLGILVAAFPTA